MLWLELLPMVIALVLSAVFQWLMWLWFLAAAVTVSFNVVLSIRDGAVLENLGGMSEKKNGKGRFWSAVAFHVFFGAFFLIGAAIMFFKRR